MCHKIFHASHNLKNRCEADEVRVTEAEWTEQTHRLDAFAVGHQKVDENAGDAILIATLIIF